ncbi:hypothetical protein HPB51_024451 [Rhipicephalus microplus]|uniref:Tick transposon n=1 Tax=Rhipicephalus microplus TaxID=6941 RepID=A0A9J6EK97_RHIMP|nr:hypothetical protein HPB51_024451 [Rhipicephalus microplus]
MSSDQYIVVPNRVIMRCLPDNLAIKYRQRMKEDDRANSGTETSEHRLRQAKNLLIFLRIQAEVWEEGRLQTGRRSYEGEDSMATESQDSTEFIRSAAALTCSTASINQVCPLYNSQQYSVMSCSANLSADEKRVRLLNNNCRFRCRTHYHIARECKEAIILTCGSCRHHHLTDLCDLSRPIVQDPVPALESVALERPLSWRLQTITTTQSMHVGCMAVLLQRGRIWARSGN